MCCLSNCIGLKTLAVAGLIAGVVGFSTFGTSVFAEPPKDQPKQAQPKAGVKIGDAAPVFSVQDQDGKKVNLSDFKGKIVVLEWFNPGCPFVVGAHEKGLLKDYAAKAVKDDGVVWLSIATGPAADKTSITTARKNWSISNPVLMDKDGTVAKAYGAKTTPHMFVIDKEGKLAYMGAIDNAPMGKVDGGGETINYVANAIKELKAGTAVSTPETRSYGCSVKF